MNDEELRKALSGLTVDVWPTAGRALGLGKNAAYAAAKAGQIPGVTKIGGRYVVPAAKLRRLLGIEEAA